MRQGTNWIQPRLNASNPGGSVFLSDDLFGASVPVSGNTVVIRAPGEDSNAARVNDYQNSLNN